MLKVCPKMMENSQVDGKIKGAERGAVDLGCLALILKNSSWECLYIYFNLK
jgi:hypothetical protein